MHHHQARSHSKSQRKFTQNRNSHWNIRFGTIKTDLAFLQSSSRLCAHVAFLLLLSLCVAAASGCGGLILSASNKSAILCDVSCGTQSLTGPQLRTCSLALNSPALTSTTVTLSTSSPALKVPAQETLLAGQTSANFDAVSSGVSQASSVTIIATSRGVTKSTAMILYPVGTGSGSSTSTQHKVQLGWSAPAASSDTIVGYNVYRATVGVSTYALLTPTIATVTAYVDAAVQSGSTYNYVVRTVDDKGMESNPSNSTQVTIP